MFFLNFGLAQFVAMAGVASLITAALYLLDRSRRRQVVSTLRFFVAATQPVRAARRRHIQQPWSLALQLLGVIFLLLAMAQPRLGTPFGRSADHVLILETSAWMGARSGSVTLMDAAKKSAHAWLASIPPRDPVMLVRAAALATPATPFETDRTRLNAAIDASQPGFTALHIEQAVAFARRIQSFSKQSQPGDVAFVGSGRIAGNPVPEPMSSSRLRVMLIPNAIQDAGLRAVSMKRSAAEPERWDASVTLRNYGTRPRSVALAAGFDRAPIGVQRFVLEPGAQKDAAFSWSSRQSGVFEVRLSEFPSDGFSQDDRASLIAPALQTLPVFIYTRRAAALQPFLAANPLVSAVFRSPESYPASGNFDGSLVIIDRFRPPVAPHADSIWIDPPPEASPIEAARTVHPAGAPRWIPGSLLGDGLRSGDAHLASGLVFQTKPGDIRVAEVAAGPVLVGRPGPPKTVVIGFDPVQPGIRFELSTPLVFANILRWMRPDAFRQSTLSVESAGAVTAPLYDEHATTVSVTLENGTPVPFTRDQHAIHFFSDAQENVRVTEPDRASVYSLALPEMGDTQWKPPAGAAVGVPASFVIAPSTEIWPWLAVLGAMCFAAEWLLFARTRRTAVAAAAPALRRAS